MKKYLLKTVVSAVLGFSLIFAGCSADDGGSGGSNAVISGVSLKAAGDVTSIVADGTVKLTATVTGENLSDSQITYVWSVDSEDYASLDGDPLSSAKSRTAEKTLTAKNKTESEQTVKVTVKVYLTSETTKEDSIELKIAAKETTSTDTESGSSSSGSESTDTGSSGSDSGSAESSGDSSSSGSSSETESGSGSSSSSSESTGTESTDTDSGSTESSGDSSSSGSSSTESESGSSSSSSESTETDSGSTESSGDSSSSGSSSETESGSVSVTVTIDGSVSCTKCGKTYELKSQAESCEHYKCETCGTAYYSQAELDACTSHVTVIFKDSDGGTNETVTKVIKSGTTVIAPDWTKEGFTLSWLTESESEYDFDDPLSVADGESETTVTFTAKWTTTYTVTFKDESGTNADETAAVISGETVETVPEWTREHYSLTGWTSSVEGLTTDSAITENVTFTAVWTEDSKYTVTFVDSDGTNTEETQSVYTGEKANVPDWTKENYVLSWTSSVEGLTTDSAITADVTFTANWTEKPKCSNCGTHYDTETEAENCSKEEGCPKYGALTTITFSGTKTASASSDNETITVSMAGNIKSGVTLTYNGVIYDPIIKMESSTVVTISGAAGKTVKVVCDTAKAIKYNNSTKVTAVADGTAYVATFTAPDGDSFTINKGDSMNVGVIFIE